jgi:RES domain-containing protein
MFLEMGHGLAHRFEPLTVCTYDVDVTDLIDLRTKKDQLAEGISRADLACAWAYDLSNGKKPASWSLAERFISGGAAGILVPSFAIGAREDMANLVLWKWGPDLPHKVVVHDPSNRLPRDQSSWTR